MRLTTGPLQPHIWDLDQSRLQVMYHIGPTAQHLISGGKRVGRRVE